MNLEKEADKPILVPIAISAAIRITFSSPFGGRFVEACISISSNFVQWATSINRSVSLILGNILYKDRLKFRASTGVSRSKRSTLSLSFLIFIPSRLSRLFETHVRRLARACILSSRYSSADD